MIPSQKAHIMLRVGERGLLFYPDTLLSAEDTFTRITVTDVDICIQFSNLRLIHKASAPLPFYSYKIEVAIDSGLYMIALAPEVSNVLGLGSELRFDVYRI